MRRLVVLGVTVALAGCGGSSLPEGVVARAGEYELRVDRLAQIMAEGKNMPIRREVAQQVANLWIDYAVFAQAIAEGLPLYDSAMVTTSMWRDVQQLLADNYYNEVVAPVANLDTAAVDSAYQAGDLRFLRHILIRSANTDAPPVKEERRQLAERVRARLASGGASWEQLNSEFNDDRSRDVGGDLGVLAQSEMVPEVGAAAFALAPDSVSPVVATGFGYHIVWRPALADVFSSFKVGVEDRMVAEADTTFLADLAERRGVSVSGRAIGILRESFGNVLQAKHDDRRIGSWDDGRFTVADFIKWFEGFVPEAQAQIAQLDDEALTTFVSEVITNHVLIQEALDNGITLRPDDIEYLHQSYNDGLALVRANMDLTDESLGDSAQTISARHRQMEIRVDQYLQAIARNERTFVSIPAYLADTLRIGVEWEVSQDGVDRVIALAEELRAVMPESPVAPGFSAPVAPPVAPPTTPGTEQ